MHAISYTAHLYFYALQVKAFVVFIWRSMSFYECLNLLLLSLFLLQVRLVRELEKKFSGRPVVFVAQRRILPKPKRNQRTRQKQLRPRRYVSQPVLGRNMDDITMWIDTILMVINGVYPAYTDFVL